MNPLVSVVIPTYNHAHFLGRALQSVVDQTYPHWEAIVVDNHSDDNTDEVLDTFRDPRIRVLKIHNNGVIAASRNLGIRSGSGAWVAFLDSDDCWYPKKLQTMMGLIATDPDVDVVSNDEMMVDTRTGKQQVLRYGPYEEDFYRALLTTGNRLSPSATIVRRSFLVRNGVALDESPDYVTVEDYDLWLNLARTGARFRFLREILGEFLVHNTNSSASTLRQLTNGEAVLRTHVFTLQQFDPSPSRLWAQVATRVQVGKVKYLVGVGKRGEAMKLAARMLIGAPIRTGTYLGSRLATRLRGVSSAKK